MTSNDDLLVDIVLDVVVVEAVVVVTVVVAATAFVVDVQVFGGGSGVAGSERTPSTSTI